MISKFVGEGEGCLREIFQKARLAGKCIIFFDEVDAVACKRLVSFFFLYVLWKIMARIIVLLWAFYAL